MRIESDRTVDARGGGEEVSLCTLSSRGLEHVRADADVVEQQHRRIRRDEAHAAHIGRKVEHPLRTRTHLHTGLQHAQVDQVKLVAEGGRVHECIPLAVRHNHLHIQKCKHAEISSMAPVGLLLALVCVILT